MRAIRKIRNRSGFSMAELLVAILILLMVSAIVAGAIPTAANVYTKTVDAANAQVLLSTVITVLRDEIGTAVSIKEPVTGKTITYVNGNDGHRKLVLQESEDEGAAVRGIWLCAGTMNTETGEITYPNPGEEGSRMLVSSEATTKNLVVKFDSVSFSGGIVTFSGLRVERSGVTLASRDTFRIRTVKKTAS